VDHKATISDAAVSGADLIAERPGFKPMLDPSRAPVRCIIVESRDRSSNCGTSSGLSGFGIARCAAERASGREYAKHEGAGQHLGNLARHRRSPEPARPAAGYRVNTLPQN